MNDCIGNKLIYNGLLRYCSDVRSSIFSSGVSLYEVVRIIKGKPLFLEDHIHRLENSVTKSSKPMLISKIDLVAAIKKLLDTLPLYMGNIKISFNFNEEENVSLIYCVATKYPDEILYAKGVHTILYRATREKPDIKRFNHELRSKVSYEISKAGAFEAILVNSENCITEGSKSNVFFLRGNKVITSPESEVLAGVTRKYVIKLILEQGLKLEQRSLPIEELNKVDSMFLSGTSPKILPVRSVGDRYINVDNTNLRSLMSGYDELLENHILSQ